MDLEQKFDRLEGEVGLMKGEIKQTLVDLREFIMKQGAPFSVRGGPIPAAEEEPESEEADAPDDGAAGLSHDDMERMLKEARASGREEATEALREESEAASIVHVAKPTAEDIEQERPQVVQVKVTPPEPPEVVQAPEPAQAEQAPEPIQVVQAPEPVQVVQAPEPAEVQQPQAPPTEPVPRPQAPASEPGVSFGGAEQEAAGALYDFSQDETRIDALDANLLTNLMRWVGGVKRRLGGSQLEGFLEIYKLTGHLPPVMEKLILHLAELEALPDESSDQIFTLDDLMDSLLQLHAVVYGPGYATSGTLGGLEEQLEDLKTDG